MVGHADALIVVGQNMRRIRTSLGISRADMAKKLGVAVNTVLNYEMSKSAMPLAVFIDVAEILGVSADTLMTEVSFESDDPLDDFVWLVGELVKDTSPQLRQHILKMIKGLTEIETVNT